MKKYNYKNSIEMTSRGSLDQILTENINNMGLIALCSMASDREAYGTH